MPDERLYDVDISFAFPELVENYHDEFRRKFEPLVEAVGALPEVAALTGLTLRISRLAIATKALAEKGLKEESQIPFRSCTESLVNLLYIFSVGPSRNDKNERGLAEQFIAHGDVSYDKLLSARPLAVRRTYLRRTNMTEQEIDAHLADIKIKREEAITNHGCTKSRWHSLDLQAMAKLVRDNRPAYVDDRFAEMILSSFQGQNSSTHSDALSIRTQYADLGNAALEVRLVIDSSYADAAGLMTMWAWRTMAIFFNQERWINTMIDRRMRDVMRLRLSAAQLKANRKILLPWEVED